MQIHARNCLKLTKTFRSPSLTESFELTLLYVLHYSWYMCCFQRFKWVLVENKQVPGCFCRQSNDVCPLSGRSFVFVGGQLSTQDVCQRGAPSFNRKITTLNRIGLQFTQVTSQDRSSTINLLVLNLTKHGKSSYHGHSTAIRQDQNGTVNCFSPRNLCRFVFRVVSVFTHGIYSEVLQPFSCVFAKNIF